MTRSCFLSRASAGRLRYAVQPRMRWLWKLERLLLIFGLLLLGFYVAARIHRAVLSNAELRRFKDKQLISSVEPHPLVVTSGAAPDFSLWSEQRVKDYQESLAAHFAPAIAILRIPKIQVEVPVLEGTDELSLNRGVGHVTGTANPGRTAIWRSLDIETGSSAA